ncbi:MAG TPA: HD domain-containing phosphohydrolase [Gemmatimonadales bacterium]|nr:HD domain-containing phosphohydrolase [Gemmatimonadales bacterium]
MSEPARFLGAFAQALAGMSLYGEGHPARARAVDTAYQELLDLQAKHPHPLFTFLGDEVIFGRLPLREMREWGWSNRLAEAGIQRLEFADHVTRDDFEVFLEDVLARLTVEGIDTAEARQQRPTAIKFGVVGVRGSGELPADGLPTATIALSLGEEVETIRWLHDEVQQRESLPLAEAEAVVRSLSVAMHGDQQMILPLLQLKQFDEYTTTHSLNVSVLSMALAEYLEMAPSDVRAFGVAGLLHDLGKVRIPIEILTKAGKLTPDERVVMNRHPVEGARLIFESEEDLDLAAVVAYEHHIMLNGLGYPQVRYRRSCHEASNLVHVCDVYDALRTRRPYRDAWPVEQVLPYIEGRAGMEFDPHYVRVFIEMMRRWETKLAVVADERAPLPVSGAAPDGAVPAPASLPEVQPGTN